MPVYTTLPELNLREAREMSGRRTIVGLALLGALFVCAISASSASAAGTTAFTCVSVFEGAQFEDEHCKTPKAGGSGFKHEEIEVGKTTEITTTNNVTGATTETAVIHSILGGVEFTIDSQEVHATGSCKNETVGEVMQWHCKKVFATFTKLAVTPASLKCEVVGGELKTKEMTAVTRETVGGKGPGLNYVPEAPGTVFMEFEIGGAECKLGKPTIKVTGNAVGKPSGATLTFDEASTKGEGTEGLFIGKSSASVTGVATARMVGGNPIVATKK
jgi:hypothetical protein